eukprot:TRINITY_DN2367_c0_g2_i1.p2 TRINITY_DN2367_c0_g2~~TRINITY_DN2367_c0_g2_i1.p2  ORF type:complete len:338 (+),score=63.72 TRINITY_DN2367_c0_g2_i1:433-1446(+)
MGSKVLANLMKATRVISSLDLSRNPIGDKGIADLSQALKYSFSLVHLDLSSTNLGPKGGSRLFKGLAVNESITHLNVSSHKGLYRNKLGTKGLKKIVAVLKNNRVLAILNVAGNAIRAEGLAYVAEGIAGNDTLMSLRVSHNEIQGSAAIKAIRTILLESKLKELDLSDNPLKGMCMEEIADILGNNTSALQRLYCANIEVNCTFCDNTLAHCARRVFAGVSRSSSLQTVRLDRNDFSGPEFGEHVASLVGIASCLHHISLNECWLGENSGRALFKAIQGSRSVRSMSLQRNNLEDATAKAFGEALSSYMCLQVVNLAQNGISVRADENDRMRVLCI